MGKSPLEVPVRLRHSLIYFLVPALWRIFPRREAAAMLEYSQTELDSAWQGLYALESIEDSKLRSALFTHALEEFYHADLFRRLYDSYGFGHSDLPVKPRQAVLKREDSRGVLDFLAYLHVGEREVSSDFQAYARAWIKKGPSDLFQKIRSDEAGHVDDSVAMLEALPGVTKGEVRWALLKAGWDFRFRKFSQLMDLIGKFPLRILLLAIYLLFGGFVSRSARTRLKLSREQQTALALEQKSVADEAGGA